VTKEELAEALKPAWRKVLRQHCPPSAKVEAGHHGGMAQNVPKAGELDSLMLPQGGKSEEPNMTPATL